MRIHKELTNKEKQLFRDIQKNRRTIKQLLIMNAVFSIGLALCIPTLCTRTVHFLIVIAGLLILNIWQEKLRKPFELAVKELEKELFESIGKEIFKSDDNEDTL